MAATPTKLPGIFFPWPPTIRDNIEVRIAGELRTDWEWRLLSPSPGEPARFAVYFEALTHYEKCHLTLKEIEK